MADNKVLNAGSGGATIATDEIGGVDFQRIKLITGADNANDGDVADGNPFPIKIRDGAGNDRDANVTAANELNVKATAQPGVDIGDVTINGAPIGASAIEVQGTAAHDAPVVGNPLLGGGEARTTLPTAVADGDAVRTQHDDLGRVITAKSPRDLIVVNRIVLTNTTETTLLAAVAATFLDITLLVMTNESANKVRVEIRDSTGGTIRFSPFLAMEGGGAVIPCDPAHPQAAVNNNWTAKLSTNATVTVTAMAIKGN